MLGCGLLFYLETRFDFFVENRSMKRERERTGVRVEGLTTLGPFQEPRVG